MKKILLILIASISAQLAYAQIGLLIKAGTNYTNNVANESSVQEGSYKFGFYGGIGVDIHLSKKLSLYPELLYANKGYKYESSDNSSQDGKLHLNYINLPVLVRFNIHDQLSFIAGPEFGYLLSAKAKSNSQTNDVKHIWNNNFDAGISAGVIYHPTSKLHFNVRYIYGVSSVIKDVILTTNGTNNEGKIKFQNRTLQIGVGYQLN